jgi:hypothetical protein
MDKISEDSLNKLTVPTVEMSQHKVQLKQALLSASSSSTDKDTNLMELWRTFMSKSNQKFVIPGATLAIVAVVALTLGLSTATSPDAYAEQLAKQGVQKVSSLSAAQQQYINQHLSGGNALGDLKTAENAKSLKVLTYAQLIALEPQLSSIKSVDVPEISVSSFSIAQVSLNSLKFLSYTDSQNNTHIIGIDSQDLPVLELEYNGTSKNSVTAIPTSATSSSSSSASAPSSSASTQSSPTSPASTSSSSSSKTSSSSSQSSSSSNTPQTSSASPPTQTTVTPLSALTSVISGLDNGVAAQITASNVTLAGPIGNAQGQPIVFTANGETYFAYTQGQKPNFNQSASATASSMAIMAEPSSDSGVVLASANLDKGGILVDSNQEAVGYSTGGN